jgi:lysophospholipase L1-like esterase
MTKQTIVVVFFIAGIVTFVAFLFTVLQGKNESVQNAIHVRSPIPSPSPTAVPFQTYTSPVLSEKSEYTIVMVGDSMTHALGPHGGTLNEFLNDLYRPHNKGIVIDNYASGSTSVLTIHDAMTTKTTYWDATFEPLLSRHFDVILIESFGYNPLSQFPLAEGLKKQQEILTQTMQTLIASHPSARIVFVATIAPNKSTFALKVNPNTTFAERTSQVEERVTYMKNHISFAKEHNIPVINIYEKSLTPNGDGNVKYINPSDNIHPSFAGVDFIGHEIANYIYDNQIIPL